MGLTSKRKQEESTEPLSPALLISSAPNEPNPVSVNALGAQLLHEWDDANATQPSPELETSLHASIPNNILPNSPIHNIGGKLLVEGPRGRLDGQGQSPSPLLHPSLRGPSNPEFICCVDCLRFPTRRRRTRSGHRHRHGPRVPPIPC